MAGPYEYLGESVLTYPSYRDTEADRMLIAEPGSSYSMAAVDESAPDADGNRYPLPVPPNDGRWAENAPPPPAPKVSAPEVSTPAPEPPSASTTTTSEAGV